MAVSWVINKRPRVTTSKEAGEIQAVFYGCDMAMMLKGLLSDLLFGNIGVEIPTYVRNDNCTLLYHVESAKSVSSGKRPNVFLETNRGVRIQFPVKHRVRSQKVKHRRGFN